MLDFIPVDYLIIYIYSVITPAKNILNTPISQLCLAIHPTTISG